MGLFGPGFVSGAWCLTNWDECQMRRQVAKDVQRKIDEGRVEDITEEEAQITRESGKIPGYSAQVADDLNRNLSDLGGAPGKGLQKLIWQVLLPVAVGYFIVSKVVK